MSSYRTWDCMSSIEQREAILPLNCVSDYKPFLILKPECVWGSTSSSPLSRRINTGAPSFLINNLEQHTQQKSLSRSVKKQTPDTSLYLFKWHPVSSTKLLIWLHTWAVQASRAWSKNNRKVLIIEARNEFSVAGAQVCWSICLPLHFDYQGWIRLGGLNLQAVQIVHKLIVNTI